MTAMATRTSPKKKFNERNNGYGHALINLCTLYLDFFFLSISRILMGKLYLYPGPPFRT